MKQLSIILMFALFLMICTNLHANNDPTADEITQAQNILLTGIANNDPAKETKINLILNYLMYAQRMGDQKVLKVGTAFLASYEGTMNKDQEWTFKKALKDTVATYISNKSVEYNEQTFKDIAVSLFAVDKSAELSADQLAVIWMKYIIKNFNYFEFADKQEPGIERNVAEAMVTDSGLFSYMMNKVNNIPAENKKLKDAYYTSLLVLNDIIVSDAKTHSARKYKGFVVPELCREIKMLTEYEVGLKGEEFRYAMFKTRAEDLIFKAAE
jgi:hypothetical protein